MNDQQARELFDTGLSKIKQEIKSQLVLHGLYGTVTNRDSASGASEPTSMDIELDVKGKIVQRSFERSQIESCHLRVGGAVLVGIIAMVDEVSALPRT